MRKAPEEHLLSSFIHSFNIFVCSLNTYYLSGVNFWHWNDPTKLMTHWFNVILPSPYHFC